MNRDVAEGKWKQMRGEVKRWWGEFTDDDLTGVGGNWDKLVGLLQEKYGYTKQKAWDEIERHFREYDEKHPDRMKTR